MSDAGQTSKAINIQENNANLKITTIKHINGLDMQITHYLYFVSPNNSILSVNND